MPNVNHVCSSHPDFGSQSWRQVPFLDLLNLNATRLDLSMSMDFVIVLNWHLTIMMKSLLIWLKRDFLTPGPILVLLIKVVVVTLENLLKLLILSLHLESFLEIRHEMLFL